MAATLVSSSGTEPWTAARSNVVRLPIKSLDKQDVVGALSFGMSKPQKDKLIEDAEEATRGFLQGPHSPLRRGSGTKEID